MGEIFMIRGNAGEQILLIQRRVSGGADGGIAIRELSVGTSLRTSRIPELMNMLVLNSNTVVKRTGTNR
jgi:hypothetical protein